jgi:hypothetical protein
MDAGSPGLMPTSKKKGLSKYKKNSNKKEKKSVTGFKPEWPTQGNRVETSGDK